MKASKREVIRFTVVAVVIAALYVGLTYITDLLNLAYGSIQFRFPEILTLLPVFTPAAIPGVVIGNAIANIRSTVGIIDVIVGPIATLLGALCTRALRNKLVKGIPVWSTLPPIVFKGLIIALEIWFMGDRTLSLFLNSCWTIALGQATVCVILGIPFLFFVKKANDFIILAKNPPEADQETEETDNSDNFLYRRR